VREANGMVKRSSNGKGESEIYRLYDLLDRYEELLEDMADLSVASIEDVERKILELNEQIDALESADNGETP
jgi:hypothetical protein